MSEVKHTPGPWFIGMRNGANSNMIYARDGETTHDDFTVCSVYRMFMHCDLSEQKDPVGIANARLIAAAPELLEALRRFLSAWESDIDGNGAAEQAISAIAKATGSTK